MEKRQTSYAVIREDPDGTRTTVEETPDYGKALVCLRCEAFDTANSGKHGSYPLDIESFNNKVEEGFDETGAWEAEDGTRYYIENKNQS